MNDKTPSDRWSTPAIVSYFSLFIFLLVGAGVFWIVNSGVKVDTFGATMLGTVLGVAGSNAQSALGYWTGASVGGKTANAALAQIAGAGAPPPAEPSGEKG